MYSVFLIFLCVVFSNVKSAIIRIDQVEISGHEGECYDKDAKVFYKKDEIIKNEGNECVERRCLGFLEETGKVRIQILTCPAVEAGPGCTITQDPSKPFPDCCPQLVLMPSVQQKFCENLKKEQE